MFELDIAYETSFLVAKTLANICEKWNAAISKHAVNSECIISTLEDLLKFRFIFVSKGNKINSYLSFILQWKLYY